jgi:hypothetical protein
MGHFAADNDASEDVARRKPPAAQRQLERPSPSREISLQKFQKVERQRRSRIVLFEEMVPEAGVEPARF